MPKIDPFRNRRLRGVTETKSFKDPAQPGIEFSLTLSSKPGTSTQLLIQTNTEGLFERFADPMAQGIWLDGEELKVTRPLCYVVATILTLDAAPAPDRYTFEELVALSYTMPNAFDEAVRWAGQLLGSWQNDKGGIVETEVPNDSAAATEQPSAPPQNTD